MLWEEEWETVGHLVDFLKVRNRSSFLYTRTYIPDAATSQIFRRASEKISGQKYTTLSFCLGLYANLLKEVSDYRSKAPQEGDFAEGLEACEDKLRKYFDISTSQSIYYYASCSESDLSISYLSENAEPSMQQSAIHDAKTTCLTFIPPCSHHSGARTRSRKC